MSDKLQIRESVQGDVAAIESLYPEAFPDEDLVPLVRDLLQDAAIAISLIGTIDLLIVGHAIFTKCGMIGSGVKAALLGPLAVAPDWRGAGAKSIAAWCFSSPSASGKVRPVDKGGWHVEYRVLLG